MTFITVLKCTQLIIHSEVPERDDDSMPRLDIVFYDTSVFYILYLLLTFLPSANLGKVEKVYVDNPSLMSVLNPNPNIGNIRETFFYNQMREKQDVISSRISDFTIGDYTFEIGGRKKVSLMFPILGLGLSTDIKLGLSTMAITHLP